MKKEHVGPLPKAKLMAIGEGLSQVIFDFLGREVGFSLIVYDFSDTGKCDMEFVSNSSAPHALLALKRTIMEMEKHMETPPDNVVPINKDA